MRAPSSLFLLASLLAPFAQHLLPCRAPHSPLTILRGGSAQLLCPLSLPHFTGGSPVLKASNRVMIPDSSHVTFPLDISFACPAPTLQTCQIQNVRPTPKCPVSLLLPLGIPLTFLTFFSLLLGLLDLGCLCMILTAPPSSHYPTPTPQGPSPYRTDHGDSLIPGLQSLL